MDEASSTRSAQATNQVETVNVRVVRRSKSKQQCEKQLQVETVHVSESDPQPLTSDDEFERLAAINVSYVSPVVGVGSDVCNPSVVGLLQGADDDGNGAGVVGSAVSNGQTGVPFSPLDCTPEPDAIMPPEPECSDSSIDELQLATPVLSEGVHTLKSALVADESLSKFRDLGEKNLNGYSFKNELLFHTVLVNDSPVSRIVVPTVFRNKVLSLAHDKTAHVGVRGMKNVLGKRFTWPGVHSDIVAFVKSCDTCLRVNSAGNRKAKMVERQIVCVPFESVLCGLSGPLA